MVGPIDIPKHADDAFRARAVGAAPGTRLRAVERARVSEGGRQLREQGDVREAWRIVEDRAAPDLLVRQQHRFLISRKPRPPRSLLGFFIRSAEAQAFSFLLTPDQAILTNYLTGRRSRRARTSSSRRTPPPAVSTSQPAGRSTAGSSSPSSASMSCRC